jgi:hypothetical protein
MGAAYSSEMLVNCYQIMWHHILKKTVFSLINVICSQ